MDPIKVQVQMIIDRMKEVLSVKTDVELAEALQIGKSSIGVWRMRDRAPIPECVQIAQNHAISLDWLVFGRGKKTLESDGVLPTGNAVSSPIEYVEIQAFEMDDVADSSASKVIKIPRDWMTRYGIDNCSPAAIRVPGNTMSPTVEDGDVVIFDRRERDVDGVYVVRIADSIRVRRVQRMTGGSLHLRNDNPAYENDVIELGGTDHVELLGYCFLVLRQIR